MSSIFPETRVKLGLSTTEIRYIAGSYDLSYEEVLEVIQNILNDVLRDTTAELMDWIDTKVPMRTGQLRDDLKLALSSSYVQKGLLGLVLGAKGYSLMYAHFVNAMSTSHVAHSGEIGYAYYYGVHGKIILNDPEAIGHFFRELLFYAKERIQINLAKAKARYLGYGSFSTRVKRAIG